MRPYRGWAGLLGLFLVLALFSSQLSWLSADLYRLASQPFVWLAEPINQLRLGLSIPLLGAFLLGVLGSLAPCQLSTNAAALSWLSSEAAPFTAWRRLAWFVLGKSVVYLGLAGAAAVLFNGLVSPGEVFTPVRKTLGPLMLVMGFVLLGWVRLPLPSLSTQRLGHWGRALGGDTGSAVLGVSFGLAFCPTMFTLFFGLMLPTAAASGLGFAFPPLFALGTALPVILMLALLEQGRPKGQVLGGLGRGGRVLRGASGAVLLAAGLYDTVVYWSL